MNDPYNPSADVQKPGPPAVPGEAWGQAPAYREEDLDDASFDITAITSGRDPDLSAVFDKSYHSTRSARETSRRLIQAFDDKGLLLAATVQPHHLSRELSCNCSELTRLVLLQWVRQGETHKLKLLGETLLAVDDSRLNGETARIMMLLGGLLGILRPPTARRLVDRAATLLRDPADAELVYDARLWVDAGEVLGPCAPEERVFWNRRLREPSSDWNWDTPESRLALNHLATLLPRQEEANLEIFQNAVPGCWWDLWRKQAPAPALPAPAGPLLLGPGAPAAEPAPAAPSRRSGFAVGLASGLAAAIVLAGLGLVLGSSEEEVEAAAAPTPEPAVAAAKPAPPAENAAPEEPKPGPPAPPIRESLRLLQSVLSDSSKPQATKSGAGSTPAAAPAASSPASSSAMRSLSKKDQRELARDAFEREHPQVRKFFSLLKDGSLRQHESLLQGQSGAAPSGGEDHQCLLEWLILDPPEQADTRLAATKMAMRELPLDKAVELFELCLYPGSPNEIEIRQCAELLLDLSHESLTQDQAQRLKSLTAKKS